MQIESLRYFIELARVGSFYGAAKNVYISQQGLNKAISSIEAELGVRLVERENRGVRLTSSGEVFLEHAQSILADYNDMLSELYAHHRTASSSDVRLAIHLTYYPAQIARPFIERMNVLESINLMEEPFQQIIEGAADSDGSELFLCDLYNPEKLRESNPELIFEPLVLSRSGVAWRKGSPLAGHAAIHRDQLANQPLAVDSHREMRHLLEHIMQDYPLNNIRFGVANPRARIEYSASADDVALMFDSFGFMLAQSNPTMKTAGLNFTPLSTPRSKTQIGFLYNKQARPSVRARHAIETLREYLHSQFPDYYATYPL